jgi:hypothetical protein
VIATHLTRVCSQHTTFCMRALRMHRDAHLLVTLTTLLSCSVLPRLTLLGGPPSPLSTRTDFRSRLDRGVTPSLFATFFEGLLTWRAHPLSASYALILFLLGKRTGSLLWERTGNLLFIFLVCFYIFGGLLTRSYLLARSYLLVRSYSFLLLRTRSH